jgi:hypothetical protein
VSAFLIRVGTVSLIALAGAVQAAVVPATNPVATSQRSSAADPLSSAIARAVERPQQVLRTPAPATRPARNRIEEEARRADATDVKNLLRSPTTCSANPASWVSASSMSSTTEKESSPRPPFPWDAGATSFRTS